VDVSPAYKNPASTSAYRILHNLIADKFKKNEERRGRISK
jgi:DNA-directed RNA polymerase specialized sigma24 family protein